MIANLAVELPIATDWMKSPKRLDQIITGYTGSPGSMGLDSIDQALGTKEGIPVLSGLTKGFIEDSSRSPRSERCVRKGVHGQVIEKGTGGSFHRCPFRNIKCNLKNHVLTCLIYLYLTYNRHKKPRNH